METKVIVYFFIVALSLRTVGAAEPRTITLDGRREGRVFEGIGACSAGASSRLLMDYAEPYRGQILDFLFKPNYGAGFQHLKVEIGGDVNSTDGCEPSHRHMRTDEHYNRGYEWWLMEEARKRNPDVILDCLEWGAPGWIGNGKFYSQDNADYMVTFIKGAKAAHGLDINYVGIWNETPYDAEWIKLLRQTLDRRDLKDVKIVAAEEINQWTIVEAMKKDAVLARAIHAVGVHYPKYNSTPAARECGKPIWSSEDGPWKGTWDGAKALAKMYNRNYITGKMTKTVIWSPVTSYYDNLPLPGSGVMKANTPWSGYYEVQPALWATAHTTQFAKPGWKYVESGGCGYLPNGGSYVTLKSPNESDYSMIVETVDSTESQKVTFQMAGGLSNSTVHVWRTNATEEFIRLNDVTPQNGAFTIPFDGGCIYSLTTTEGQTKGAAASPSAAPFPMPDRDDFESYAPGTTPKYFSDQAGIFEIAKRNDGDGNCLRQVIDKKGIEWHDHLNPYPETFLGSTDWRDYEVSADALIEKSGFVSLFGRVGTIPQNAKPPKGYWLKVGHSGDWELLASTATISSGKVPFSADSWHTLRLRFAKTAIKAFVDNKQIADVEDRTFSSGMVGVGCGWHTAQFDNLSVRSLGATASQTKTGKTEEAGYLFSSFRRNGQDGLHLAYSRDGCKWTALNNDKPFLAPRIGQKETLMRDPCILQGPDGTFHMVWTTGWQGKTGFGYACSKDLIHWSEQKAIPVMEHEPEARNCWAPELFYDDVKQQFLIFWSTTIPGRFPETDQTGDNGWNHRIYYVTTRDFKTFSPTKLLFDGGFNVIDATILKADGKYSLIVKDETKTPVKKNLRTAVGDSPEGPWRNVSEPFTISWVEGPSAIKIGDEYFVYFDHYARPQYYGAVKSRDLKNWEDVSKEMSFPNDHRHGTVFRVSEDVLNRVLELK